MECENKVFYIKNVYFPNKIFSISMHKLEKLVFALFKFRKYLVKKKKTKPAALQPVKDPSLHSAQLCFLDHRS